MKSIPKLGSVRVDLKVGETVKIGHEVYIRVKEGAVVPLKLSLTRDYLLKEMDRVRSIPDDTPKRRGQKRARLQELDDQWDTLIGRMGEADVKEKVLRELAPKPKGPRPVIHRRWEG